MVLLMCLPFFSAPFDLLSGRRDISYHFLLACYNLVAHPVGIGPQGIQKSPIEARAQVHQCSSERPECDLLLNRGLPEPLKSQRHIALFTLEAQGRFSARMAVQPAPHQLAQALL